MSYRLLITFVVCLTIGISAYSQDDGDSIGAHGQVKLTSNKNNLQNKQENPSRVSDGRNITLIGSGNRVSIGSNGVRVSTVGDSCPHQFDETSQCSENGDHGESSSNENGNEEQDQIESDDSNIILNSSNNEYCWISLLLCLLIIAYIAWDKKQQNSSNKRDVRTHGENTNVKIWNNIQSYLEGLEKRIELLERKSAVQQIPDNNYATRRSSSLTNGTIASDNTAKVDNKITRVSEMTKLYASMIRGEEFPELGLSKTENADSMFVLSVNNNEGSYVINESVGIQSKIISSFAYTVARVVEVRTKVNSPKSIKTVEPGKVKKSGESWKIIKKAIVDIK